MLFARDGVDFTGPKLEAQLRKELGAAAPIPFATFVDPAATSGGVTLGEAFRRMLAGKKDRLHVHHFRFTTPRPWELAVEVVRTVQSYVLADSLLYSARLARPVGHAIELDAKGQFTGDDGACAKLNGDGALRKAVVAFARTELKFGDRVLHAPRIVSMTNAEGGSELVIASMPKPGFLGLKWSLEPKAFLEIADRIEKLL